MERSRMSTSSFTSPIKGANLDRLQQDKKYILKKIHYLFVHYAARASRYAYKELNEKAFMELMFDTWASKETKLIKHSDAWKKLITIYYGKGKKTSMDYESFLKKLPAISEHFCKGEKIEEQLKRLLKHLLMVYDQYVAKEIENKYVEFDNTFKNDTSSYIQKLSDNLYTLYKLYFPEQITNQAYHSSVPVQQGFERIVLFFKQFQIYPKIITASQLYLIYLQIINSTIDNPFTWLDEKNRKRDRVSCFGFSKYLELLVRTAVVGVGRLREVQDPQWWLTRQKQCLKALFQYMEGVRTKNKNSKFQHVRFSLILYDQYKSEQQKWTSLSVDQNLKPTANHGDFFELFQKMRL